MKIRHDHPSCRPWRSLACICGLLAALTACSAGGNHSKPQPPISVATAMPVRQTFHARVAAYGQLVADSRAALSLSLPQAGLIIAPEVIAGQRVKRGAPLLKLETDPATRSAYLQAQSSVTVARDGLTRTEALHAGKLATDTQVDAARKALADAKAALAALAQLGGAKPVATLPAPADGVVTAVAVQRGQRVAAGATLVRFAPTAALVAQLGVDPVAAPDIRSGMPVTLDPVYAAHGARSLAATVVMAGNAVDPQTHLVDVVATLDAPTKLAAGTALSASIATAKYTAWAVPRAALQNDAQGSYVFQIEHGKAQRVDVQVLAPDGSPVGVDGALDPHAPVITLGSYEVSDGDAVEATPSAAAQSHGTAPR